MTGTRTVVDEHLVTIRLLGFPLKTWQRSSEHHDGLMREFALFALSPPTDVPGHQVPRRLRELVEVLNRDYGGFTEAANEQRDEALAAGRDTIDLTYRVPGSAGAAAAALGELLDEADEFCRNGDLLTLATPPDVLAFRRWFLAEFTNQIDGQPPRPWPSV